MVESSEMSGWPKIKWYWPRIGLIRASLSSYFSTFWLSEPKCTEIWSEKAPDLSHLGPTGPLWRQTYHPCSSTQPLSHLLTWPHSTLTCVYSCNIWPSWTLILTLHSTNLALFHNQPRKAKMYWISYLYKSTRMCPIRRTFDLISVETDTPASLV